MIENHMDDVILFRRFQGFVCSLIFSLMVKILDKNVILIWILLFSMVQLHNKNL